MIIIYLNYVQTFNKNHINACVGTAANLEQYPGVKHVKRLKKIWTYICFGV